MEKRYDRAALIQGYIAIKEPYGHEDFKWGEIDTVVTSEQLRQLGFDDAQEPNRWDYE